MIIFKKIIGEYVQRQLCIFLFYWVERKTEQAIARPARVEWKIDRVSVKTARIEWKTDQVNVKTARVEWKTARISAKTAQLSPRTAGKPQELLWSPKEALR